jgi:hypothetical protein
LNVRGFTTSAVPAQLLLITSTSLRLVCLAETDPGASAAQAMVSPRTANRERVYLIA